MKPILKMFLCEQTKNFRKSTNAVCLSVSDCAYNVVKKPIV